MEKSMAGPPVHVDLPWNISVVPHSMPVLIARLPPVPLALLTQNAGDVDASHILRASSARIRWVVAYEATALARNTRERAVGRSARRLVAAKRRRSPCGWG